MLFPAKIYIAVFFLFFLQACYNKEPRKAFNKVLAKANQSEDFESAVNETLISEYIKNQSNIEVQKFTVSPTTSEWLTAKKGFKIFIDPKKLCNTQGGELSQEALTVNITELLTADDMMATNATTISNGKMLLSGGTYFVEITQNNQPIHLKKSASLPIQVPNLKKTGMQLFSGAKNQQGFVNWQPTQSRFIAQTYYPSIGGFYKEYDSEKIKDSIGKRPATLAECMKIYNDSTMKARWAYTIANRHKLTHKQEMAYGLRPVEFPYDRYKQNLVRSIEKYYGCYGFRNMGSLYATSSMYMINDTFPIYKEIITIHKNNEKKASLDYYEPIETYTLGWINVDKFYNVPMCDSTMLVFNNAKMSQCKVYYKFTELNSLLAETIQFEKSNKNPSYISSINLPKNESIEIIVIGIQNGKIVQGRKKITSKKVNMVAIQLQEITQSKKQT